MQYNKYFFEKAQKFSFFQLVRVLKGGLFVCVFRVSMSTFKSALISDIHVLEFILSKYEFHAVNIFQINRRIFQKLVF